MKRSGLLLTCEPCGTVQSPPHMSPDGASRCVTCGNPLRPPIPALTLEQFHAVELWILAACARNSAGPGVGPGNYAQRREEARDALTYDEE